MGIVSIEKCNDYELEKVRKAVRAAIDNIGGISKFVKPNENVLLKVNLLMKRKPERVTTTHPLVAQAVAELVIEAGGIAIIGDSPGGYHFYNSKTLQSVYETCGMTEAAKNSGALLNLDTETIDVPYPEGHKIKLIKTIKPVIEVDKVISIPKVKTHMMTVYSGAVKNLFGIIPGSYKAEYHLRFEDKNDFADLLIDLCLFAKPVLSVMDAVLGMEGYGPTAGSPKKIGLIIAAESPFDLDVVASKIIGLKPLEVPTIVKSIERGLTNDDDSVKVIGEKIENVLVKDFKKPTRQLSFNYFDYCMPKFIKKRLAIYLKPKPVFDKNLCIGCAMCAKSCPPKAIEMVNGKPELDLNKCIRCFCCHELCNVEAIKIKKPWYLKLLLH